MNELNKALGDINCIRRQMARSTEFRGYGAATLAMTGCFAVLAAILQQTWIPHPAPNLSAYLGLWAGTAILSASLIAVQTVARSYRIHSGMADEMIFQAVEQFLPSAIAGFLITVILLHVSSASFWMIPALWQITYSLGVFSSCRFLPRPMIVAGAWYLLSGLSCLSLADARTFSPWAMGIPFGVGQLLVAAVLYFHTREDRDDS